MEMEILQCFFLVLVSTLALSTVVVHSQDQTGFISIDCGLPDNESYRDSITKLNYTSDAAFIDTGISKSISPEYSGYSSGYSFARRLQYVRSFPKGDRNCYKVIDLNRGVKYLIRATFMYGNYDDLNKIPKFGIHLGPNKWYTVQPEGPAIPFSTEIIHVTTRNYLFVCLVNTGSGTPFISALELRPLNIASYKTASGSLVLRRRLDIGSITNATVRFPDDIYDRIWQPYNFNAWEELNNNRTDEFNGRNSYMLPSTVMRTAVEPANLTEPLNMLPLGAEGTRGHYYVYMHFAELAIIQANQSREFDIFLDGKRWYGPLILSYLQVNTIYVSSALNGERFQFSLNKTEDSTLPPLINAIESYDVLELSQVQSDHGDVDTITNIKSTYNIERNWQGDPCAPQDYMWEGLNCNYNDSDYPRIISLNLSSSGLSGDITPYISGLTLLQTIDLSNNSLNGSVPDFLSHLPSLKFLNISGNQLTGSVPSALLERSKKNLLVLSTGGNPNLCASLSCKKEKRTIVVPILASVSAVLIIMAALAILFWSFQRRKQQDGDRTNKPYNPSEKKYEPTYCEVLKITNNFERILGKGGFGTVYHGILDGTEVAVKLLSPSSVQGSIQFQAEVKLLSRVHHRNLTSLLGFCDDGTSMGLIYEYMACGDLEKHISGTNTNVLTWESRLQIAVDAAKGLEYLHNGCRPPITHRDVKTSNILLNDKLQAKLADFGLSRPFLVEGDTHVSTNVVGTPGYLDPEYSLTCRLTEKSDVYSFGVVLLRIITGKPVLAKANTITRNTHLSQWVRALLENGDIKSIVDPRLAGDFNINSIWKAVETALACTSPTSPGRPAMLQVVTELNECLAEEIAQRKERHGFEFIGPTGVINESFPLAR